MFMVCFNNVINPFIGYDHKNCIENFGQIHVIVNEVNVNYSRPFFTLILLKYNTLQHNLTYLLLESEIAYFIFLKNKLLQHYTTISSVSYPIYDAYDKDESVHPFSRKYIHVRCIILFLRGKKNKLQDISNTY